MLTILETAALVTVTLNKKIASKQCTAKALFLTDNSSFIWKYQSVNYI